MTDLITLPDLWDTLSDAAGLLDQVAEQMVAHLRQTTDSAAASELSAVEDFASQAWACTRRARTLLTEYIATSTTLPPGPL